MAGDAQKKIVEGPWRNITDETIVQISRYSVCTWQPCFGCGGGGRREEGENVQKVRGWSPQYLCSNATRRGLPASYSPSTCDDWGMEVAVVRPWCQEMIAQRYGCPGKQGGIVMAQQASSKQGFPPASTPALLYTFCSLLTVRMSYVLSRPWQPCHWPRPLNKGRTLQPKGASQRRLQSRSIPCRHRHVSVLPSISDVKLSAS